MTLDAPAAIALVTSPEYLTPPSAMIGTSCRSATRAQSAMAVICGTPMPATTRVVQMLPGPDADLDRVDARVDERLGRLGGGDVAGDELDVRELALGRAHRVDDALASGRARCRRRSRRRPRATSAAARSARSGPGPMAAPTRRRPLSSFDGVRVAIGLEQVLDGDEPDELAGLDDEQLLDAVLVQQLASLRRWTRPAAR